jgi:microcystin-dependent protein
MVYIGHQNPLLIFPDNVRDDIVPNPPQVTFTLSQTVPGGYEGNILAIHRKFQISSIIENTADIEFVSGVNEIICNDADTAQQLAAIKEGEAILISGATNSANNGVFIVTGVVFTLTSIVFTVLAGLVDENLTNVDVRRGKDGPWEILKPEIDYTVGGVDNKEITFSEVLEEADQCYVIHRGSATYNLVPTNNSVGPEQLSHNLRNFSVDRFEGDGIETDFTLSQEPVNGKTILVTVDGEVLDGDDPMAPPFPYVGDWELIAPDTLKFHLAPANTAKIRVLHLGFSTVSRRAALSDGQIGAVAPGSITQLELANSSVTTSKIADVAVTTAKIANDSVNHNKILLPNNQSLRALRSDSAVRGLIRLNASNETTIQNDSKVRVDVNSNERLTIEDGTVTVTGDLVVTGSLNALQFVPSGSILMSARASAPSGYLLCRGQAVSRVTFADLFAAIGTVYGPGDGVTTFNLPDLRQRFPIGQTDVPAQPATNLGDTGGDINHTHTISHSHNVDVNGTLPNHIHSVGTLAGSHAHTHKIDHVHNIAHDHIIPTHRHNYSLTGTTELNSTTQIPAKINSTAGVEPRLMRASGAGGANNTINEYFEHSHTFTISTGGSNRIGGIGSQNVDTLILNGSTKTGGIANGTGIWTGNVINGLANMSSVPISGANDSGPASTSVVTISGDTGNNTTTPNINSTGSTISQDISVSGAGNPPYIVLNFIIKT